MGCLVQGSRIGMECFVGVENLCGMFCSGWQKWHGIICPVMFCPFVNPVKDCHFHL